MAKYHHTVKNQDFHSARNREPIDPRELQNVLKSISKLYALNEVVIQAPDPIRETSQILDYGRYELQMTSPGSKSPLSDTRIIQGPNIPWPANETNQQNRRELVSQQRFVGYWSMIDEPRTRMDAIKIWPMHEFQSWNDELGNTGAYTWERILVRQNVISVWRGTYSYLHNTIYLKLNYHQGLRAQSVINIEDFEIQFANGLHLYPFVENGVDRFRIDMVGQPRLFLDTVKTPRYGFTNDGAINAEDENYGILTLEFNRDSSPPIWWNRDLNPEDGDYVNVYKYDSYLTSARKDDLRPVVYRFHELPSTYPPGIVQDAINFPYPVYNQEEFDRSLITGGNGHYHNQIFDVSAEMVRATVWPESKVDFDLDWNGQAFFGITSSNFTPVTIPAAINDGTIVDPERPHIDFNHRYRHFGSKGGGLIRTSDYQRVVYAEPESGSLIWRFLGQRSFPMHGIFAVSPTLVPNTKYIPEDQYRPRGYDKETPEFINELVHINELPESEFYEAITCTDEMTNGALVTVKIMTNSVYDYKQNDPPRCVYELDLEESKIKVGENEPIPLSEYEASWMIDNKSTPTKAIVTPYDYEFQTLTFPMPNVGWDKPDDIVVLDFKFKKVIFRVDYLIDDNISSHEIISDPIDPNGNPFNRDDLHQIRVTYHDSGYPVDQTVFLSTLGIIHFEDVEKRYVGVDLNGHDVFEYFYKFENENYDPDSETPRYTFVRMFTDITPFGGQTITFPKLRRHTAPWLKCWAPLQGVVDLIGDPWVSRELIASILHLDGAGEMKFQWMRSVHRAPQNEDGSMPRFPQRANFVLEDADDPRWPNTWPQHWRDKERIPNQIDDWEEPFVPIRGEVSHRYFVRTDDKGHILKLRIWRQNRLSFIDSAWVGPVTSVPLTGVILIEGNPWISQPLLASVLGLSGEGRIDYRWQWAQENIPWNGAVNVDGSITYPNWDPNHPWASEYEITEEQKEDENGELVWLTDENGDFVYEEELDEDGNQIRIPVMIEVLSGYDKLKSDIPTGEYWQPGDPLFNSEVAADADENRIYYELDNGGWRPFPNGLSMPTPTPVRNDDGGESGEWEIIRSGNYHAWGTRQTHERITLGWPLWELDENGKPFKQWPEDVPRYHPSSDPQDKDWKFSMDDEFQRAPLSHTGFSTYFPEIPLAEPPRPARIPAHPNVNDPNENRDQFWTETQDTSSRPWHQDINGIWNNYFSLSNFYGRYVRVVITRSRDTESTGNTPGFSETEPRDRTIYSWLYSEPTEMVTLIPWEGTVTVVGNNWVTHGLLAGAETTNDVYEDRRILYQWQRARVPPRNIGGNGGEEETVEYEIIEDDDYEDHDETENDEFEYADIGIIPNSRDALFPEWPAIEADEGDEEARTIRRFRTIPITDNIWNPEDRPSFSRFPVREGAHNDFERPLAWEGNSVFEVQHDPTDVIRRMGFVKSDVDEDGITYWLRRRVEGVNEEMRIRTFNSQTHELNRSEIQILDEVNREALIPTGGAFPFHDGIYENDRDHVFGIDERDNGAPRHRDLGRFIRVTIRRLIPYNIDHYEESEPTLPIRQVPLPGTGSIFGEAWVSRTLRLIHTVQGDVHFRWMYLISDPATDSEQQSYVEQGFQNINANNHRYYTIPQDRSNPLIWDHSAFQDGKDEMERPLYRDPQTPQEWAEINVRNNMRKVARISRAVIEETDDGEVVVENNVGANYNWEFVDSSPTPPVTLIPWQGNVAIENLALQNNTVRAVINFFPQRTDEDVFVTASERNSETRNSPDWYDPNHYYFQWFMNGNPVTLQMLDPVGAQEESRPGQNVVSLEFIIPNNVPRNRGNWSGADLSIAVWRTEALLSGPEVFDPDDRNIGGPRFYLPPAGAAGNSNFPPSDPNYHLRLARWWSPFERKFIMSGTSGPVVRKPVRGMVVLNGNPWVGETITVNTNIPQFIDSVIEDNIGVDAAGNAVSGRVTRRFYRWMCWYLTDAHGNMRSNFNTPRPELVDENSLVRFDPRSHDILGNDPESNSPVGHRAPDASVFVFEIPHNALPNQTNWRGLILRIAVGMMPHEFVTREDDEGNIIGLPADDPVPLYNGNGLRHPPIVGIPNEISNRFSGYFEIQTSMLQIMVPNSLGRVSITLDNDRGPYPYGHAQHESYDGTLEQGQFVEANLKYVPDPWYLQFQWRGSHLTGSNVNVWSSWSTNQKVEVGETNRSAISVRVARMAHNNGRATITSSPDDFISARETCSYVRARVSAVSNNVNVSDTPQLNYALGAFIQTINPARQVMVVVSLTESAYMSQPITSRGNLRELVIRAANGEATIQSGGNLLLVNSSIVRLEGITLFGGGGTPIATVSGGRLILDGSRISNNQSSGLLLSGGSCDLINGAEIIGCSAQGTNGGGANVRGGILNIYEGSITSNRARDGGGIALSGSGIVNMMGGRIDANGAEHEGGGVHISGGQFRMAGGIITQNVCYEHGGGVRQTGGTFNVQTGAVTGNDAHITTEYRGGLLSSIPRRFLSWSELRGTMGIGTFRMENGKIPAACTFNSRESFSPGDREMGRPILVVNGIRVRMNSSSSRSCLPVNTLILTVDGFKKLCELKVGDEVVSRSLNGKQSTDKIWHIWKSAMPTPIVKITFDDGTEFKCNPAHVFERRYFGPGSIKPAEIADFIPLCKIQIGNKISTINGWKTIKSIEKAAPDYIGEIFLEKEYYYYAGKDYITSMIVSGRTINKYIRDEKMIADYRFPISYTDKGPCKEIEYIRVLLNSWRIKRG